MMAEKKNLMRIEEAIKTKLLKHITFFINAKCERKYVSLMGSGLEDHTPTFIIIIIKSPLLLKVFKL